MDILEKKQLKEKMKLYKRLGAEQFQIVVFGVERLKFKVLKTVCPNFIKYFDKFCDFRQKRAIKKANSEEEIENIKTNFKFEKMAMRKEFNQEKNRNYHMDTNKPTEIYKYLEWNKKIHKRGLIKNAITIPVLTVGTVIQFPGALLLLIAELIGAGINFECVNIQNYNMCRYKLMEERLKSREEKIKQRNIEEYKDASKVIAETIQEKEKLPTIDEIVGNIESKDQLEQLRKMVQQAQKERVECITYSHEQPRQKVRGNK